MSNDPAANMASLCALCDDLCETESATVDRRQLCEWLSAMQAQAHDIERLTRGLDALLEQMREEIDRAINYLEIDHSDRARVCLARARAALGGQP